MRISDWSSDVCSSDLHPQAKREHGRSLEQRRLGAPGKRQTGNAETDRIVGSIAEEVERIGLERAGVGGNTGPDLAHEHGCVRDYRAPQDHAPERLVELVTDSARERVCPYDKLRVGAVN